MGFYCQKLCGGSDYKKDQIEEAIKDCIDMDFTVDETAKVLKEVSGTFEQKCIVQCNTCAGIVTETQIKTKALIDANEHSAGVRSITETK